MTSETASFQTNSVCNVLGEIKHPHKSSLPVVLPRGNRRGWQVALVTVASCVSSGARSNTNAQNITISIFRQYSSSNQCYMLVADVGIPFICKLGYWWLTLADYTLTYEIFPSSLRTNSISRKSVWQWETHYLRWSAIYLWNTSRKQHWVQQTTNPLSGSDTSTALSVLGNMDQQDCNNFFAI
jgi:hypothetical protein